MAQDLSTEQHRLLLRRADGFLKAGQYSEVQDLTGQILATDGTHAGALELLAKAQWALQAYHPLLETLSRLIRINPYEPGYHTLRGTTLHSLGRYGEAIRAFARAGEEPDAVASKSELSAMQAEMVIQLLEVDRIFRAEYAQDPEAACVKRGFEFGSDKKIRMRALLTEFSATSISIRPS